MSRGASQLGAAVWLAGVLLALFGISSHTQIYAAREAQVVLTPPPATRLDSRLLDVVTLGYRGLYDDLIVIWTLQELADPRLMAQPPAAVAQAIQRVTRLEPKLETFYMLGCFVLDLDLNYPRGCEPVILDGLKAFPQSWRLPVTQAFIAAHNLDDPARAAMYYDLAASRPGAPAFLARLALHLREKQHLTETELQETFDHILNGSDASQIGQLLRRHAENRP